uniref:Uncharacterized protein n=1 Tax=Arundo donax TaxID=35708 RepID=A0A0A9FP85_ARUDO
MSFLLLPSIYFCFASTSPLITLQCPRYFLRGHCNNL